jgi:hypothetical protein
VTSIHRRISRLEVRHRQPAVYPVYTAFAVDGGVESVHLSDGSRRTGDDAIITYRPMPRSFPLKIYIGFDPKTCI